MTADDECSTRKSVTHPDEVTNICLGVHVFYGSLHDIPDGCDVLHLPDSVHPIKCLIFKHGIPLGFHKKYMVGSSQIQSKDISISCACSNTCNGVTQ